MSIARPKQYVTVQSKQCSKCGIEKPASEFVSDPRHADGLRAECKECFYSRERYLKDQEWRRAHPERIREYNAANRHARLRYQALRPLRDPEGAAARNRRAKLAQRARDPVGFRAKIVLATHRRRSRKKGNGPNDLTHKQWETIKNAYGHCCAYCGRRMERLTIDHVLPLVLGGPHTAWNIVPACAHCNIRKGARMIVIPDYSRHPFVHS